MEIRHTSATDYGQIYVPRMNAMLAIGVVLIVLIFKGSDALTAAYGIAVTGVMVIDTFNAGIVAGKQWRWTLWLVIGLFGAMGISDLLFFIANSLKIPEGGWLPLFIAACVFIGMDTAARRRVHLEKVRRIPAAAPVPERADKSTTRVAGLRVSVIAHRHRSRAPAAQSQSITKCCERVVILNVVEDTPGRAGQRLEVEKLGKGFYTVRVHHGFSRPDVPQALGRAASAWRWTWTPPPSSSGASLNTAERSELALSKQAVSRLAVRLITRALLSPAQPGGRIGHADHHLMMAAS